MKQKQTKNKHSGSARARSDQWTMDIQNRLKSTLKGKISRIETFIKSTNEETDSVEIKIPTHGTIVLVRKTQQTSSRGLSTDCLVSNSRWWTGAEFLSDSEFPKHFQQVVSELDYLTEHEKETVVQERKKLPEVERSEETILLNSDSSREHP
ncbi:integrase catalytic domain-containing protein [Trichonephila clavipes]|nr:integrase catalytic domain-containing protein [Trichonephila clavipes]